MSVPGFQSGFGAPFSSGQATMLMPRTCSLSIGTAHDNSVPRSLRFGAVPGSRMLGMMNMFGTMHSAWRTMRLPFG